jgi:UPF0755 protein
MPPSTPSLPTGPAKPARKRGGGFLGRVAFVLALTVMLGVLVPVAIVAALFAPGPLAQPATVVVPLGLHTADIAGLLEQQKAIYLAPLFRVAARTVAGGSLKAGEYAIPAGASAVDIALMMHEGKSVVRLFTVAEGLTSAEIVKMLNADPVLTGDVGAPPAEGTLLPETYRYIYGDTRASLIARMQKGMQDKLNEAWAGREAGLPLRSPREVVTLASIVEKETGRADERPRIAGVFYNRLRVNMRLQSDPTVIYALTHGSGPLERPLTHDDLSVASPINTYASEGLPPQPICNPGMAALLAVTRPEHNTFLYFVADGSGGHAFAADLATQDRNINRWHQAVEQANQRPAR